MKTKLPKTKSTKAMHERLWKLVSEYVRRSYADANGIVRCYTCGALHHWKDMQCGHYIHKNCLDFEMNNLRPQCVHCNHHLSGNSGVYAEKLIKEIGMEEVDLLRAQAHKDHKFTILELDGLILTYKGTLAGMPPTP